MQNALYAANLQNSSLLKTKTHTHMFAHICDTYNKWERERERRRKLPAIIIITVVINVKF